MEIIGERQKYIFINLFVGDLGPTREFLTAKVPYSALVLLRSGVLQRATLILWHGTPLQRLVTHLLPSVQSGAVTTCFNDFGLSPPSLKNPTLCMRDERSNRLFYRRGFKIMYIFFFSKTTLQPPISNKLNWRNIFISEGGVIWKMKRSVIYTSSLQIIFVCNIFQ